MNVLHHLPNTYTDTITNTNTNTNTNTDSNFYKKSYPI